MDTEYSVSVTCQIWQLGTLMYKKDNYVTVLRQSKIAILADGNVSSSFASPGWLAQLKMSGIVMKGWKSK